MSHIEFEELIQENITETGYDIINVELSIDILIVCILIFFIRLLFLK